MSTEADTCTEFVLPKLEPWRTAPHSIAEQRTFTDGRILIEGRKAKRGAQKRLDYLLRYTADLPLAVVEAKKAMSTPYDGLQQAKEYAQILDLQFAYSTNGHEIIEFDFGTGETKQVETFPTPKELWARRMKARKLTDAQATQLLVAAHQAAGKQPRYYQEIAINRALEAIVQGRERVLLTMATGTGKTLVAFQICWRLWQARWNRKGLERRPRVLYLADRRVLVDQPFSGMFSPFEKARWRIGPSEEIPDEDRQDANELKKSGLVNTSREMYFATYQSLGTDSDDPLFKRYDRDFFDLVLIDECHRGSANDVGDWRQILDWFEGATKLGMTATPRNEETWKNYEYFGDALYTYSLRQGIEDGFLAPYSVLRVSTNLDAYGLTISKGEKDRSGKEIPNKTYAPAEFEKKISIEARNRALAQHLASYLRVTDPDAKTIVFCVDQEHASLISSLLSNEFKDRCAEDPAFVCRITADEGDLGKALLDRFQDVETKSPVIVTTSQLLTTGVDVQTAKNVVLMRLASSMIEFKQIIGRGTRVRADLNKLFFTIVDYVGDTARWFNDPAFDGKAEVTFEEKVAVPDPKPPRKLGDKTSPVQTGAASLKPDDDGARQKLYYDGGIVRVVTQSQHVLDADGTQLRAHAIEDRAIDGLRNQYPTAAALKAAWMDPPTRAAIRKRLKDEGIDLDRYPAQVGHPNTDLFDLLAYVAYATPIRTRADRVDAVRQQHRDYFKGFSQEARVILHELLDRYVENGKGEFDVSAVKLLVHHGSFKQITAMFGGPEALGDALQSLQSFVDAV